MEFTLREELSSHIASIIFFKLIEFPLQHMEVLSSLLNNT
jgi:hypothetical protein